MSKPNLTFCGSDPTWANACVGNNGNPGYWDYSKGFSRAANLLIDEVLKDLGINYSVDEFIYPVCFNMRHSVELRLKGAIEQLQAISRIKGFNLSFNMTGSHDISVIWNYFKTESEILDARYKQINKNLDSTIQDISQIDATGQTFRYPVSSESQKHLAEVSIINFCNLKYQFKSLESGLDTLHRLNTYLLDEYALGSFTESLTRNRLLNLAHDLPARGTWAEINFKSIKEALKSSCSISGNELSKAIKIIEDHYEFGPSIEVLPPLRGVIEKELVLFLKEWCKLHEVYADTDDTKVYVYASDSQNHFDDLVAYAEIKTGIWGVFSQIITPEMLAGLSALYYFAEGLGFSENYICIYAHQLKVANCAVHGPKGDVKQGFFHLLMKTGAMHNIVKSLYFLNHTELAENLVRTHDLASKFPWLEKARSRELFKKPIYCGYAL